MAFSPEFTQALTTEVFARGDSAGLHDVVVEVSARSLSNSELRALYGTLPPELQILALQWGLSDTQFRDDVYTHLINEKLSPCEVI